jgi:hypothetical protein
MDRVESQSHRLCELESRSSRPGKGQGRRLNNSIARHGKPARSRRASTYNYAEKNRSTGLNNSLLSLSPAFAAVLWAIWLFIVSCEPRSRNKEQRRAGRRINCPRWLISLGFIVPEPFYEMFWPGACCRSPATRQTRPEKCDRDRMREIWLVVCDDASGIAERRTMSNDDNYRRCQRCRAAPDTPTST